MKQALHIKNLTKKYKDFTLDHISLDLPYGMILGLIGENGSGKSTLINSILNIVKADYDEVHILGQDLKSQEKEIKKEIAVIFNDSHYGENLTPLFIGKMLSGIYTDWDQKKFTDYLKQFHLPEKKRLKTFSTGMKVKLEFAAALSHNPKLLILDEATTDSIRFSGRKSSKYYENLQSRKTIPSLFLPISQAIWIKLPTISHTYMKEDCSSLNLLTN